MKFTATVTIGRNIGDEPMRDGLWREFRDDVEEVISNLTVKDDRYTMEALANFSKYGDTLEESATYVFGINLQRLAELRPLLHKLARHYSQECIALVIGQTDLVGLES